MRRAGPQEGPAVLELVREAFAHYVPRIGARPRPMDEDYAARARGGELWVAGEPIVAALVLEDADDHLWLDVIAVDPARQGSGLGRELMRFAEEEGRTRGRGELRLLTNSLMTENLEFYARLGYEAYDRRDVGATALIYLRKPLGG